MKHVANGTPVVSGLNLRVSAPVDPHSHDDHVHFGSRSDVASVPSWTSEALVRGHSLVSRMAVNGKYLRVPRMIEELC